VVGHSYGGVVAMLAAGRRPQAVRSLTLIEPAAFSAKAVGTPVPEVTPDRLRAAATALRERPGWDAEVPIESLAACTWPKLVITGTWETASPDYRAWVGEAMTACGRIVAERIGATLLCVRGAAHEPHREQPAIVNAALRELWERDNDR
jgi:pimeloyl-ACP methyl ester carboxylesterase